MNKKVRNSSIAGAFAGSHLPNQNQKALMPTPIGVRISDAFGDNHGAKPIFFNQKEEIANTETNWYGLEDLYNTFAENIIVTARDVQDLVNSITATGYFDDPKYKNERLRFATLTQGFSIDISRFTDELNLIKELHADKHGFVPKAEYTLYLGIFEKYQSFIVLFDSTKHHTVIEFTNYALDAKNYAQEKVTANV